MMTLPFRTLILSAALLAPALAGAQAAPHVTVSTATGPAPAPAADAKITPEHAAAIRQMLDAIGLPVILRYYMAHPPANSVPEQRQLLLHMGSHVSDDDIMHRLIPVYAKYVSRHAADVITVHYRSGAGRRQALAMLANLGMVEADKKPLYTQAEIAQTKRFEATLEAHELSDSVNKVKADLQLMSEQWGAQYYLHLLSESTHSVSAQMTAAAMRKEGEPAAVITVPRTGLPMLDLMVQTMADNTIEIERADRQFKSDLAHYGLDHLLAPERLTSKDGLAQSREALRQIGVCLERLLHDMDQQQENYRKHMMAINGSKPFTSSFEVGMASSIDWQLRYADNQRGLLDVFGRMLTFAESRLGVVSVESGKLLFKNDDDLQVFRTLKAQLQQYSDEEVQLRIQRQQSVQQALKQLG